VAQVLPVPADDAALDGGSPWTEADNARRCALIDQEIAGTLTIAEAQELSRLQRAMLRHRQRVAPLPLEDARSLYQDLLARADPASEGTEA
jgi:hypothetical protein